MQVTMPSFALALFSNLNKVVQVFTKIKVKHYISSHTCKARLGIHVFKTTVKQN